MWLQDKNFFTKKFLPNLRRMHIDRMHIQDGGMHTAFDQNKSIYFETQARYGIIVKEVYISF
jgi:hypothetical protein